MPPKKRNKAYTKKRKGKSKGVPRASAASASAPATENDGVASTAATTTPAAGGTKATTTTTTHRVPKRLLKPTPPQQVTMPPPPRRLSHCVPKRLLISPPFLLSFQRQRQRLSLPHLLLPRLLFQLAASSSAVALHHSPQRLLMPMPRVPLVRLYSSPSFFWYKLYSSFWETCCDRYSCYLCVYVGDEINYLPCNIT